MGQQQSKDELLYQQVNYGNVDGIKSLRSEGAGLEWVDREGKTPLIVACMNPQLHNVAKTLIELGANVNAYRPGRQAGTPLHHAAKRGLEQTVKLLLSHGANALVVNDDCQTPIDVARAKGFSNVVRTIEAHLCLFSGWLRELYGPGFLELLAPQLLSRKVWVVVLPCGSRNFRKPLKLELAIYSGAQDAQPRTIIPLWKANLEEPNFNLPDPAAIIADVSRSSRIKLAPLTASEKHQLQRFCNACKGIPQAVHPLVPSNNQVAPTAPQTSEDEELAMAINTSLQTTSDSYIGSSSITEESHISGPSTSQNPNGKNCEVDGTAGSPAQHLQSAVSVSTPSAPLVDDDNGPINYPSIDTSPVDLTTPSLDEITGRKDEITGRKDEITGRRDEKKEDVSGSTCTICLDAPLEGACVPCGHLAGCMSCLNEINDKKWGCPVCRAKIDQIIRIYSVV